MADRVSFHVTIIQSAKSVSVNILPPSQPFWHKICYIIGCRTKKNGPDTPVTGSTFRNPAKTTDKSKTKKIKIINIMGKIIGIDLGTT
ncbi:MAG: hypothetical protein K2H27_03010, partial [Duncaniella sp.]|nr:hypothetical protein [Duncaniella sp.]